jgi:hypothetical protein
MSQLHFQVISSKATPISVVMPARLLAALLGSAMLSQHVPLTDLARLTEAGLDFGVLPIVLFFVGIGTVTIVAFAAWACVLVFGNAANQVVVRFLTPAVRWVFRMWSKCDDLIPYTPEVAKCFYYLWAL